MKTWKLTIILLNVLLIGFSCTKSDRVDSGIDSDYLVFGHFRGECLGEQCVEIFKLTDKKLYEDTRDDYFGAELDFVELSKSKFELVKNLKNEFPQELLLEPKTTFGCPDCVDQGGLIIQYAKNGTLKSWRVDTNKSKVPEYLHAYMDKIIAVVDQINK